MANEEEGLVRLQLSGALQGGRVETLRQNAAEAAETIIRAADSRPGKKVNILLDISAFDGAYDAEAVTVLAEFARGNAPFVLKTAVFGASDKGMLAGEVITALAGRDNIEFFPSGAAALQSLAC